MIDVAIIGAGAAGIAAGRKLQAAGRSVLLLEARAAVGGRAHTNISSLGVPADSGAAWLHFADINPLTPLARDLGFTVIEQRPDWGGRAHLGRAPPSEADVRRWEHAYERNHALIEAAAHAGRDVAVSDVIPDDEFRTRFDAVMTWAVGAESREISTVDLASYADSDVNWAVAEGLGQVVARAAVGLPLKLSTPVTAVRWDERGVIVVTPAGDVAARAAIVTLSTSVLARGELKFVPALPLEYAAAFDALPLGVVNKVFFRVDPAALPFPGTVHVLGDTSTARTASYAVRPGGQPLIMGFFGGDLSRELEAAHGLAAFARAQLGDLFGQDLLHGIRGEFATAWHSDPWARGSYSVARPGCARMREVLARPVAPTLHFAGEAGSRQYYGTLLGAWLEGERAAATLLTGSA
ncbi:MAG: NAD(P)/FAD-dependent oxidoreductase [Pseudomonadota bacterium]